MNGLYSNVRVTEIRMYYANSLRLNREDMKKKILNVFAVALVAMAAVVNTGCSNESSLVTDGQPGNAGGDSTLVSFNFALQGFAAEKTVGTRALAAGTDGRVIASSVADAGNGLEVMTEVVEDAKPQTRAGEVLKPAPAQNYTILAYQNGVKKAEWVGRFDGTNFTVNADHSKVQAMKPGMYKFYVFSDHLKYQNGKITFGLANGSINALSNIVDVEIRNQKETQTVSFQLGSPYARVRMRINGFSSQAFEGSINGALKYKANTIEGTCEIDPARGSVTYSKATQDGSLSYNHFTNNIEGDNENISNGTQAIRTSHIITPEDAGCYFLSGTHLNQLSFQFSSDASGTIYRKPVRNRELPLENLADAELKTGKSYTITQTIYYKADYLFDDYKTVGSLVPNMKKGLNPVALVVDKDRHICMGLEDVPHVEGGRQWADNLDFKNIETEDQNINGLINTINRYDGWAQTWDGHTTDGNVGLLWWKHIKAKNPAFAAFNALKEYKSKKEMWYVPGAGEWYSALKYLGIADPTRGFGYSSQEQLEWGDVLGYRLLEVLFYQAGGYPLNDWYWAADDWKTDGRAKAVTVTARSTYAHFGGARKTDGTQVRPFVNY